MASFLILDNRDSFVWNLARALEVLGVDVQVVRSDETSVTDIARIAPTALVLSPGPGKPRDAGVCEQVVRELGAAIPILGVCLGHQAIVTAHGGTVDRGTPRHGKTSPVHHRGAGLFAGLPQPFDACRYHSLEADRRSLPAELECDAWTEAGTVMAVRHRTRRVFGVQFHPESFRTPVGQDLLANFVEVAR